MSVLLTVLISTAIVVAAGNWHPADRHYGKTAAYDQNTQELNMSDRNWEYYVPEFHAVVEQEENNDVNELSTVYTLPVESLEVGQTIGVVFRNPDAGWVGLTLVTENGDFVLRIAFVIKYAGGVNTVILYASMNDILENLVAVDNFPFPESGTATRTVVSATVEEEGFAILSANGDYLTFFPYQGSLTYDKVKAIEWGVADEFATKKSILRQISITFP